MAIPLDWFLILLAILCGPTDATMVVDMVGSSGYELSIRATPTDVGWALEGTDGTEWEPLGKIVNEGEGVYAITSTRGPGGVELGPQQEQVAKLAGLADGEKWDLNRGRIRAARRGSVVYLCADKNTFVAHLPEAEHVDAGENSQD